MDTRELQVFAENRGSGLILNKKGELYAFGTNRENRFGKMLPYDIPFENPSMIAKNVKHAALGGTCTIYVTDEGDVKMIGDADYAARFPGFSGAEKVFAVPADIYIIEDKKGKLYGFGQNNRESSLGPDFRYEGRIIPKEEKEIYRWTVLEQEFECELGDDNTRSIISGDCRSRIHSFIREHETYQNLVKNYGDANVKVLVDIAKEDLLSVRYERKLFGKKVIEKRKWTFEAWFVLTNDALYEPVPYHGEEFRKSRCFTASMYYNEKDGQMEYEPSRDMKKAVRFAPGEVAVLSQSGALYLHSQGKNQGICMDKVTDISAFDDTILIAKDSGEILLGVGSVKKILSKKSMQNYRISKSAGAEWTQPFTQVRISQRTAWLLNQEGKLYSCQYDNEPINLIAENVKHMAVGYNTVIYVTWDNEVKLIVHGSRTNCIAERFEGFHGAERVYASVDGSTYVIEDTEGGYHGFGYNTSWYPLCPHTSECIHDFGERTIEVVNELAYKTTPPYTGAYIPENDGDEKLQALKFELMNTEIYRSFLNQYDESNVSLCVKEVNRIETGRTGWADYKELVTYRVYVMLENNSIFKPIPCSQEMVKKLGNDMEFQWIPDWMKEAIHLPIRKIYRLSTNCWLILCEDGSLVLCKEKENEFRVLLTDVADMDMREHFIISEKSGDVLMGEKEAFSYLESQKEGDLKSLLNQKNEFYVMRLKKQHEGI